MTDAWAFETLTGIGERIRRREVSSTSVTTAALERIERLDGRLRSYTTVLGTRAVGRATLADREIERNIWRGPLHGVPVAVKDLCFTEFAPTGAGTSIHQAFTPEYNATVVDRLERAGAVILGKTAMTEGAYISHHPHNPGPLNPWDAARWVGSSSTGSGVATASGLCFASLGSDTGGSIRFPSAACGLTGLKPTWGRVSRHGIFPMAASLDHVGPMARCAADCAAVLQVIAGRDPEDATSLMAPVPEYFSECGRGIRELTVGIDRRDVEEGADPEVAAAVFAAEDVLRRLGARIRDVTFPDTAQLIAGWLPFCAAETAISHSETYPARAADYGPDLAGLIERGRTSSAAELGEIYHHRLVFAGRLAALFQAVDVLLIPTMSMPVPTLARLAEARKDPREALRIRRYTSPFDFSGSPTITMPAGIDANAMPLSVQLVGRHLSEDLLCRAAHAFQQVTDWHTRRPPDL